MGSVLLFDAPENFVSHDGDGDLTLSEIYKQRVLSEFM